MDTIGEQKLYTFIRGSSDPKVLSCAKIRNGEAYPVSSYMDLATKVAELQFRNRDFVLLYRGQNGDWRNRKRNTSLKPSLFRMDDGNNPGEQTLMERFDILREAEVALTQEYYARSLLGRDRLKRQQILRWSILQHYRVCQTPLLDVTHSLRIAASFATDGAEEEAFVFVLGVPNLSGAVTASAEAGIQIVRLASVCPPTAVRPHIQEGYLLGEYPEMAGYDQKQHYKHHEIDFGRRLVAKFSFNPRKFWKDDAFPEVQEAALYPDPDPLLDLSTAVRRKLDLDY